MTEQKLIWPVNMTGQYSKIILRPAVHKQSHLKFCFLPFTLTTFKHLTTATQNGGSVPAISRSFHYWQPAPRWRLLPWLANPGRPTMSPHAEVRAGTCHTARTVEKREEVGGGGEPSRRAPLNCHSNKMLTMPTNAKT